MSDPSSPSSRRRSRLLLGAIALLVVAGLLWFLLPRAPERQAPPPGHTSWSGPVPVTVATAAREDLTIALPAIGTVTALQTITVRSRVEGELMSVDFREGQAVRKGQLLARIDPRPFEVMLAETEGRQQQNLAQLQNAEADLQRYERLFKQDSIARQQLDNQRALVRQYRGMRKSDQAQVDNAKLQLSYTSITAPIDGRIGLRLVDAGNLVQAGAADGLAVITQVQPIAVLFTIPETRLDDVLAPFLDGETLTVQAWNRDETRVLATGELATLDNRIDTTTGTLRLRAVFPNQDEALFPNQFVNVRLHVRTLRDAVVIPADAVQYGSIGPYVYVVDDTRRARLRRIELGPTADARRAVAQGLAAGERVVLEGLDRLSDGREVQVMEDEAPGVTVPGAPAAAGATAR